MIASGAAVLTPNIHYNVLQDDIDWMNQYNEENKRQSHRLIESEIQSLINLFEIESAAMCRLQMDCSNVYTPAIAAASASTKLKLRGRFVEAVYKYWLKKRKKIRKPLMRDFRAPPDVENPSPHVAFRPRHAGRRISTRNPRKNDFNNFNKMRYLKRDFVKLLDIVELMIQREKFKSDSTLLQTHIFDEKLRSTTAGKKHSGKASQYAASVKEMTTKLAEVNGPFSASHVKAVRELYAQPRSDQDKLALLLTTPLPPSDYSRKPITVASAARKKKAAKKRGAKGKGKGQAKLSRKSSLDSADMATEFLTDDSDEDIDALSMASGISDTDSICSEDSEDERYYRNIEEYLYKERGYPNLVTPVIPTAFDASTYQLDPEEIGNGVDTQKSRGEDHITPPSDEVFFDQSKIGDLFIDKKSIENLIHPSPLASFTPSNTINLLDTNTLALASANSNSMDIDSSSSSSIASTTTPSVLNSSLAPGANASTMSNGNAQTNNANSSIIKSEFSQNGQMSGRNSNNILSQFPELTAAGGRPLQPADINLRLAEIIANRQSQPRICVHGVMLNTPGHACGSGHSHATLLDRRTFSAPLPSHINVNLTATVPGANMNMMRGMNGNAGVSSGATAAGAGEDSNTLTNSPPHKRFKSKNDQSIKGRFRGRYGRNGRLLIDRILFDPFTLSDSHDAANSLATTATTNHYEAGNSSHSNPSSTYNSSIHSNSQQQNHNHNHNHVNLISSQQNAIQQINTNQ